VATPHHAKPVSGRMTHGTKSRHCDSHVHVWVATKRRSNLEFVRALSTRIEVLPSGVLGLGVCRPSVISFVRALSGEEKMRMWMLPSRAPQCWSFHCAPIFRNDFGQTTGPSLCSYNTGLLTAAITRIPIMVSSVE
jgi:hypothetical protein